MLQRFSGSLLGLALGDALGAPHEGGVLEQLLWRAVGTTGDGLMRWTDDTQMSLDLADSLIALGKIDCDDIARRFAAGYRWSRGYGPGAAKVLKRIARGQDWRQANRAIYPQGSFGNGAAMRAPVLGLYLARRTSGLLDAVTQVSSITHVHPLAINGALLVAAATAHALTFPEPVAIIQALIDTCDVEPYCGQLGIALAWLQAGEQPDARAVAAQLGNGIAATLSCVTSIYIALRFLNQPFLDMQRFVVQVKGDVDTIGAMAGAIWGAANGLDKIPHALLLKLEQRERLLQTAEALFSAVAP
jgi:ADP-ribosylglycohydrolase